MIDKQKILDYLREVCLDRGYKSEDSYPAYHEKEAVRRNHIWLKWRIERGDFDA